MNDKLYWLIDDLKDFLHEKIICRLGLHREMYVEELENQIDKFDFKADA